VIAIQNLQISKSPYWRFGDLENYTGNNQGIRLNEREKFIVTKKVVLFGKSGENQVLPLLSKRANNKILF